MAGYGLWAVTDPSPVFVNKILFKCSQTIHLCTMRHCFCACMVALSSCIRNPMVCKAENIYYLALYKRSLPSHILNEGYIVSIYKCIISEMKWMALGYITVSFMGFVMWHPILNNFDVLTFNLLNFMRYSKWQNWDSNSKFWI